MHIKDLVRTGHILEAAREALSFVAGKTLEEFLQDRMRVLACVKELEIIGEAAAKISAETRRAYPSVPWTFMAGMRHKLVHDYQDIDPEIVWLTLVEDLPSLVAVLEPIVGAMIDAPQP